MPTPPIAPYSTSEPNGHARDWLVFASDGAGPNQDLSGDPSEHAPDSAIDASIAFLRRFHQTTLWALSTFGPGEHEVGPARTFDPSEENTAREFIQAQQGKRNVYFSVNRVTRKLSKKASKADIEEIHWLQVDADLNKQLDWSDRDAVAAEKDRVLERLQTYNPSPTAIVWSGGGYQGFWRLSEIIVVNGNKELMAPIECRMQRIAKAFGADACHNADRIMRLPGTINVLGKTKINAGRKPALAETVEFHEDRIYDIEDFPPEPEPPPGRSDSAGARQRSGYDDGEYERARSALQMIPADDYDSYLRIGMALMSAFGDAGFGLYREWAMSSIKFNDGNLRKKWESIKPEGGVTIATLFGMARDHGWRDEYRAARASRPLGGAAQDGLGDQRSTAHDIKAWPKLRVASDGLVGELAKMATRESEADPLAVMATTLASGAAAFGRNRFMRVGDTLHHARLMSALVGATARGRKGTSWGPVERTMRAAESILQSGSTLPFPSGLSLRISYGPLSSGEGLIEAIRDKRGDDDTGGIDDKRLLVVEGELGAALRACQRQGNTLSTLLRVAWDGYTLAPLTKRDKIVATDPHVCIVAHITRHELAELLTATDVWNGFANRFLWTVVRRRAEVPFPKAMADDDVQYIAKEFARVIGYAHSREGAARELVLSNSAASHWAEVYSELTQEHTGILGAVTSRAEAQTLRLAMTYALFAGADRIELQHLEAALAFWRYCFDSAAYLFGGAELDPVAQTILQALATGPKTQTEVRDLFGRHLPADRLAGVLTDLQERGKITLTEEQTGGRPRRIWSLAA